ncbi:MAG: DUF2290 domain-containing protein [Planctomycetaceae bacterium]|jgi:hypothetical protein|nr:DUF2290 domain-containing protein [Planctomycetaceae bacterium]
MSPNKEYQIPIRLKYQIFNGFRILQHQELIYTYNSPICNEKGISFNITYPNHQSGTSFSNHPYGTIDNYLSFLQREEYSCLFWDASILQIYYEFNGNQLLKHRLTWYPCPFSMKLNETGDIPPLDWIDLLGTSWQEHLVMRSPIRFDFDAQPHRDPANHPASHLHFNDKSCRILVSHPLCFNRFIGFIFNFFYPEIKCELPKEILWNKNISADFGYKKAFLGWK